MRFYFANHATTSGPTIIIQHSDDMMAAIATATLAKSLACLESE